MLETIDVVNDLLAEGGCADILYFDFSKAFDSVPHHRLLIKLKGFGIPDYILDILEDFLVGRSMRVKVGHVFSTIKFILSLGYPKAVYWGLYFSYFLSMTYLRELGVY